MRNIIVFQPLCCALYKTGTFAEFILFMDCWHDRGYGVLVMREGIAMSLAFGKRDSNGKMTARHQRYRNWGYLTHGDNDSS